MVLLVSNRVFKISHFQNTEIILVWRIRHHMVMMSLFWKLLILKIGLLTGITCWDFVNNGLMKQILYQTVVLGWSFPLTIQILPTSVRFISGCQPRWTRLWATCIYQSVYCTLLSRVLSSTVLPTEHEQNIFVSFIESIVSKFSRGKRTYADWFNYHHANPLHLKSMAMVSPCQPTPFKIYGITMPTHPIQFRIYGYGITMPTHHIPFRIYCYGAGWQMYLTLASHDHMTICLRSTLQFAFWSHTVLNLSLGPQSFS